MSDPTRVYTPNRMYITRYTIRNINGMIDKNKTSVLEVLALKAIAYHVGRYNEKPTGEDITRWIKKKTVKITDSNILLAIQLLLDKEIIMEVKRI